MSDDAAHWIQLASETKDDSKARENLRKAIASSTQYGVNKADDAVRLLDDPFQQRRLYFLLAEIAPNKTWEKRFLQSAELYKLTPLGDFGSPGLGDP